jgi:hypothetical protein
MGGRTAWVTSIAPRTFTSTTRQVSSTSTNVKSAAEDSMMPALLTQQIDATELFDDDLHRSLHSRPVHHIGRRHGHRRTMPSALGGHALERLAPAREQSDRPAAAGQADGELPTDTAARAGDQYTPAMGSHPALGLHCR